MKDALSIFASHFAPPRGKSGEAHAFCLPSLTGSSDAFLALTLANGRREQGTGNGEQERVVLAITPGLPDADRLADDLKILTSKPSVPCSPFPVPLPSAYPTRVIEFPPLLDGDRSALGLRLKTIAALKAWPLNPYPCVVVASFPALSTPIPMGTDPIIINTDGPQINFSSICDKLPRLGYERHPQVEKEGDYSIRGGILDVWSPGEEFPVRVEFFGDDLESLRTFNPALQTSIERIERAEILPISAEKSKSEVGVAQRNGSLFDLLPKDSAILALEHNSYNLSAVRLRLPTTTILYTGDPPPPHVPTYDFQTSPLPGFSELGADEAHHPELFDAARKRLDQHLASSEKRGAFILKLDELSGGFELSSKSESEVVGVQRNAGNSTVRLPTTTTTKMPRIVVAHGQMDSRTLAKKMRDFERGEYDILLSTTIIESGIDIPRANTILVDQADTFGMADLYQLRGRVGRSAQQGYAYFLLPPSGIIDSEARERLAALKRHGGLGSGFNLAVRDLELRGAGNLLGSQQSGHIAAVGFGLYCQLLKRTIAMMKGEKVKEVVDVKLNLDFANPRLPYEYIEEDVQRLSLMKRFAEAQDVRIVKALAAEMKDRFGPLPDEAKEYVRIAELRVLCAAASIEHIDVKGTRAVFYKTGSRDVFKVIDLKGKTADRKLSELIAALRNLN